MQSRRTACHNLRSKLLSTANSLPSSSSVSLTRRNSKSGEIMRTLESLFCLRKPKWLMLATLVLLPHLLHAQWNATVGAQSRDLGRQVLAFLPNEVWIHAGDSITWILATDEPHTVTFLIANQIRNPFSVGCPGYSNSPASFDGSTCVSSPPLAPGQTFTVSFPATGNFKISCLFHENMSGTIHVLDLSQALPHDQAFYDNQAKADGKAMLSDMNDHSHDQSVSSGNGVTAGLGEVVATGGGTHTLSIMRFMQKKATIHAGDTLEWTSGDVITPHTITFGTEPQDLIDPSPNVTVDADGARHAVLNSTSDSVHSGFIQAAPQDRIGLPQSPLGVTRFRVMFSKPGVYHYICALHDGLGMKGTVVVLP
jgi:plastocyanin